MKAIPIQGQGTSTQAWKDSHLLAQVATIDCAQLVPRQCRAVVISTHPADEVLGFGGLLQWLAREQRQVLLVSLSDGTSSHPGSSYWTPQRLSIARPLESADALKRLGLPLNRMQWVHGGFSDTRMAGQQAELSAFLDTYLQASDVVFAPWSEDAHSDHGVAERAARSATQRSGARLHEVPMDAWQGSPLPWSRARRLPLDKWMQARKRHAMQAFASLLYSDPASGHGPLLTARDLQPLQQSFEVVFL